MKVPHICPLDNVTASNELAELSNGGEVPCQLNLVVGAVSAILALPRQFLTIVLVPCLQSRSFPFDRSGLSAK